VDGLRPHLVPTQHRMVFGQAVGSLEARVRVPGLETDVIVEDEGGRDDGLRATVDAAYRPKYALGGGGSVGGTTTDSGAGRRAVRRSVSGSDGSPEGPDAVRRAMRKHTTYVTSSGAQLERAPRRRHWRRQRCFTGYSKRLRASRRWQPRPVGHATAKTFVSAAQKPLRRGSDRST
jgi:hypothetical protein